MKRLLLIFTILTALGAVARAQAPIRWRLSVKMTDDTTGIATVRALISEGWHLYGMTMPEDGPRPTRFITDASESIEFTGDASPSVAAAEVYDPMAEATVTRWDSNVSFTLPFTVTGNDPVIKITVSYMGCNDTTCLPPSAETLTYKIK